MRFLKTLIFILLCLSFKPHAQNLVPNPSFETYTSCPFGDISKVPPWCGLAGGEDIYNSCANSIGLQAGVPYQLYNGFQYAHSGQGFGSVLTYLDYTSNPDRREYMQVQLFDSLRAGRKYCGRMYVNLFNDSQYSVDKIGMLVNALPFPCYQAMPSPQTIGSLNIIPQIENTSGIISDTLNWVEVSGVFTASGGEKNLVIGNFYPDSQTNWLHNYPTAQRILCYFFIDDVSLEEVRDAQCIKDTTICSPDSVLLGSNLSEAAEYSWSPSIGLSCTNCPNPKAFVNQTITYTLTKKQCKVITTDQVTITLKNDCGLVNIPNVFTPNEDGVNDTFMVSLPNGYSYTYFSIYNRWGNIIYQPELKDKSVLFWDGHTSSGEKVSDGTYFYTIKYINGDGNSVEKKGCISLFR